MAAVDLAALVFTARTKGVQAWLASMACAGIAAFLSALVLRENGFGGFRLLAWGVFLHGPVLLAGSALVWWPARKILAVGSAAAALLILVVAVDAFLVEPTWLEVSRHRIRSEKIDRPIRIVVLADLQTDRIGGYERAVFRRALQEKPDLLLLAGDYIQAGGRQREALRGQLNAFLRRLDLPERGRVFAVEGNIDRRGWPDVFRGTSVRPVLSTETFEAAGIRLTCLGRDDSFDRWLEVDAAGADRFHLVLGHSPNFALGRIEADLLVAGHTHGGQVRLPFVGPLVKLSAVPRGWAAGLTELPDGSRLLVSRGVGMERSNAPRFRFLCRPELVVIDLAPESE
jgi:predicted MPP superfamily phosphohydrolase